MTIAVLFMLVSPAVVAAPSCDFRDRVLKHLAEKYQEAPVAVGITTGGGLMEVLSMDDGQTWTVIVTRPDGWACLVASGTDWRPVEPKPEGTAL